ncbi:tropomyosin-like [Montipora capricornis]|uniref:tropomyosin-like n=1 Tax=Montipora capricornis TaxID=246305 RepID=UPI0035F1FA52
MKTLIERVEQISAKLHILDEIERKMNKLDSIEEKMEKFSSRLDDIEKSVSLLRCEVNSSKEKQAEIKRFVDEVKDSVDYAHARIDKLDVEFKEAKENLRKKILYLETYSRRENLKFVEIPEENSDQEDTKNVLTNFISRQLEIENPEDIEFQRVHRIGKKGDCPRMVIARFLWYAERIMRNAYKLKNTVSRLDPSLEYCGM